MQRAWGSGAISTTSWAPQLSVVELPAWPVELGSAFQKHLSHLKLIMPGYHGLKGGDLGSEEQLSLEGTELAWSRGSGPLRIHPDAHKAQRRLPRGGDQDWLQSGAPHS